MRGAAGCCWTLVGVDAGAAGGVCACCAACRGQAQRRPLLCIRIQQQRRGAALAAMNGCIACAHAYRLPALLRRLFTVPLFVLSGCRQNYQAYQEALQGLDSIVGYAVKANNNFKIMQVGGLPLLLGALEGAASAASLPQCCWSGACCRVSLLGAAAAA